MSGSRSQLLSLSGGKINPLPVSGRGEEVPPLAASPPITVLLLCYRAPKLSDRLVVSGWVLERVFMASGCYSLLPLQLPSLGLQPPAPPRRPSLRPCATQPRLLSFFVFRLAILLIRRCLHCTSVGHLLGSLFFFPWLQVPASSPRKGRRASWPSLFRDVVILSL